MELGCEDRSGGAESVSIPPGSTCWLFLRYVRVNVKIFKGRGGKEKEIPSTFLQNQRLI